MPTKLPSLTERVDATFANASEPADAHGALHAIARAEPRARGYALDDDDSRAVLREYINSFAVTPDRRAYRVMQGRALDAAEGLRQLVNGVAAQLDAEPQYPAEQDLTPVEQVAAKRKASGIYAM